MNRLFKTLALVALPMFGGFALAQNYQMKQGISFGYPAGWRVKEIKEGASLALLNDREKSVSISVTLIENIVSRLPANEAEWASKARAPKGGKVETTAFEKTSIAGVDAIRVSYATELGGAPFYSRAASFQKNGNQVHIALHSKDKGQLEAAGAAFDTIVESFAFK